MVNRLAWNARAIRIMVGSTLSSPERVTVANPTPGTWTVLVSAFALPAEPDFFWLYAKADGTRLPATQ